MRDDSIRRMMNKRNTSSMKTLHNRRSQALIITVNTNFYISLITIQVILLSMLRSLNLIFKNIVYTFSFNHFFTVF